MKKRVGLLIGLIAVVLASLALLAYLLSTVHRHTKQAAEATTRGHAAILAARFDAMLRRTDATLQRIARSTPVAALSEEAVARHGALDAMLQSDLLQFPELYGLRIFDTNGNLLYTSDPGARGANIADREHFRVLRDDPNATTVLSEAVIARTTGRAVFAIIRAIRDGEGVFRGAVAALIDLEYFQKLHETLHVGANGTISLIRSDNYTQVMRSPPLASGKLNMRMPPDAPVRRMTANKAKSGSAEFVSTTDGVARIYSMHALEGYPLFVTVGLSSDEVLADWRKLAWASGIASLVALGLLFSLLYQLGRADAKQAWLAGIVDASNDAIVSRDLEGKILSWNRGAEAMFGYSAEEAIGRPIAIIVPGDLQHELKLGHKAVQPFTVRSFDSVRRNKDGREIYVSISGAPLRGMRGMRGGVSAVALIFHDISARHQADEIRGRLAAVIENTSDAIYIRDMQGRIVYWNDGARRMYGYESAEVLGKESAFLTPPDPELQALRLRNVRGLQQGVAVENHESVRLRKDGTQVDVSIGTAMVKGVDGRSLGFATIARDITERKKAERHIEQLATRDALTGLSNRNRVMEQMSAAIAQSARTSAQLAVMFIDLDQFKSVNDTLGHAAGDALLRECARRITECVREVDIAARLGGDEFVVLLTGLADNAGAPVLVADIAERMLKLVAQPYRLQNHDANVSASIGVCFYPADGEDVNTLLKNADIAMYYAKERGRNNYQFFSEEMNQRTLVRQQLVRELQAALQNDEFVLHYQPQVALDTGVINGVEALIRWQHPVRGLLLPGEFITVAEEAGLITPIGEWVLNHACKTIKAWHAEKTAIPHVVVNVSPVQLRSELVATVREAMATHGIAADWLVLEITETMLMERVEEAIDILRRIRELGVRIALDDFGTGYSSLSVLQRLPLDTLKIDRSFVMAIDDESGNHRARAIIGAIVAVAKELNLSVVAEGVETETQLAFLRTLKCDTYQGFLYSRPIDTQKLVALVTPTMN